MNILSIFRRKQPSARRALTPAEARQQQIAARNAESVQALQAQRQANATATAQQQGAAKPRAPADGRQQARHYLAAHGVEKTFGGVFDQLYEDPAFGIAVSER